MLANKGRKYLVGNWLGGVKTIEASNIAEAVCGYLDGVDVIPTQERASSDVFACEKTIEVERVVFAGSDEVSQAETLAEHPASRHFRKSPNN